MIKKNDLLIKTESSESVVLCPWCHGMGEYVYRDPCEYIHTKCEQCNETGRLLEITTRTYKKIDKTKKFNIYRPLITPIIKEP